jgi:predicted aspartyl protease
MFIRSWLAVLTALGLAAGPAQADCKLGMLAALPVTMVGLRPTIAVKINGKPARFLIDSGGFYSIIYPWAAQKLDLKTVLLNSMTIKGAGGEVRKVQMTSVKTLTLAELPVHDIDFLVVAPSGQDGDIAGLIGENVLGMADVEYDLGNGMVRLFTSTGCTGTNLGYWAKGGAAVELPLLHTARLERDPNDRDPSAPWTGNIDRHIQAVAQVNGKRMDVTFDTGAGRSLMTLSAAARAGVTPQSQGVVATGRMGGFGTQLFDTWIAPFDSFALGDENIRNTKLQIGSADLLGSDMLLGADFFLAHRIYIANTEKKAYLTYNGGPVFRFDKPEQTAPAQ